MKVVRLEWHGKKVRVVLEGRVLDLLSETVLAQGLREGMELEDGDVRRLLHEDQVRRAKEVAFRYLARPRTVRQVRDRLARAGFEGEVVEEVIRRLEELGLLDDKEFAKAWVEERLRLRPRWRRALWQELARKGISREVVEEALHEGLSGVEEYEVAEGLLRGMERRYRNLDPERALRRMQDFLLRRGFTWEIVKEVTGALRKEWFGDEVGGD